MADGLDELRAADPSLCYRAIAGVPLDEQSLATAFSPENSAEFQQAVPRLYEAANRGMGHERSADDQPYDSHEAALEFSAIRDELGRKFGSDVAEQVARHRFPAEVDNPGQVCSARIYELRAMMELPQGMAASMIYTALGP